jgi:hypothetical protein
VFDEQAELVYVVGGLFAGLVAADIEVEVPTVVGEELAVSLQPTPHVGFAQHRPHQLHADDDWYLESVVEVVQRQRGQFRYRVRRCG